MKTRNLHHVGPDARKSPRARGPFGLVAPSLALTTLTLTLLAACGDGDREGGQCEVCRSSQPRCDSGLTCRAATINLTGQTVDICFAANQTRCDGYF